MKNFDDLRKTNSSDFDVDEPSDLHFKKFDHLLDEEFHPKKSTPWKWVGTLAILIITIGGGLFYLNQIDDSTATAVAIEEEKKEFPLEEAEFFYSNTIDSQLKLIAQTYQDKESKAMIQKSQELIDELELEYSKLEKELSSTADLRVAEAMILNYKSRISVLEILISKLKYVNQIKNNKDENVNA